MIRIYVGRTDLLTDKSQWRGLSIDELGNELLRQAEQAEREEGEPDNNIGIYDRYDFEDAFESEDFLSADKHYFMRIFIL